MKKLATLLIAAGLVFGVSTGASAIDFKAKGEWIMSFEYGQHGDFQKNQGPKNGYNGKEDEFNAKQRVRLQLDAVASESLSGTVYFEIGDQTWGKSSQGGSVGADGVVVEVKRAYLDWMIPETTFKVRMGIQGISTPNYAEKRSNVFGDDVAGITVSGQITENVGLTLAWARPLNDNYLGKETGFKTERYNHANYLDNVDLGLITLPLTFDGIKVTPWFMMAGIGPNALKTGNFDDGYDKFGYDYNGSIKKMRQGLLPAFGAAGTDAAAHNTGNLNNKTYATAWWAGVTADVTYWDPFRIAFDFVAGGVQWDNSRLNRAGWLAELVAEYKMDWGTPGLIGWYGSGDDDDLGNGSERLPVLDIGAGDSDFSHFASDGNKAIGREAVLGNGHEGTWGIGLRVKDFSFMDDLKHTFRINYIGGTNEVDATKKILNSGYYNKNIGVNGLYLNGKDNLVEFGLETSYKMYDNFKVVADINYLAANLSKKTKRLNGLGSEAYDAWNANVYFVYSF